MTIPSPQPRVEQASAAFDLKAGQYTLPSLVIREDDPEALDGYLSAQIARLPRFFDQAPIVIDLSHYPAQQPLESLPTIVGMLRGYGMYPVGVRGASPELREQAALMELATMPEFRPRRKTARPAAGAGRAAAAETLVIDRPVRSGQRVYARGGDLVLLEGVSSGAEVMADGHIHAYGPVRGRMLAGVRDNPGARIFCRDLGAELVAIAGRYRVSEDLPGRFMGRSVQISLENDALKFASL